MGIIKNRKLFGVLNPLDIFIIVFILLIVLPALHFYIKFNEKGFAEQKALERYLQQQERVDFQARDENRGSVEVGASFKNLTEEALKKIKVGDKEILPDGTVLAEILWLGKPEPDYYFINNLKKSKSEYRRMMLNNELYSLPAKLKLEGFIYSNMFYYKAVAEDALARHPFFTDRYRVDFVIETFPFKEGN